MRTCFFLILCFSPLSGFSASLEKRLGQAVENENPDDFYRAYLNMSYEDILEVVEDGSLFRRMAKVKSNQHNFAAQMGTIMDRIRARDPQFLDEILSHTTNGRGQSLEDVILQENNKYALDVYNRFATKDATPQNSQQVSHVDTESKEEAPPENLENRVDADAEESSSKGSALISSGSSIVVTATTVGLMFDLPNFITISAQAFGVFLIGSGLCYKAFENRKQKESTDTSK